MPNSLDSLHLVQLLRHQIEKRNLATAMQFKQDKIWQDLSWKEIGFQIDSLAESLLNLGVGVQDKVAIFGQNSVQWALADIASLHVRAVVVPIYPTSTADQAAYIINDAGAKCLFIGDQGEYDKSIALLAQCPTLTHLILMSDDIKSVDTDLTQLNFSDIIMHEKK